mgnify:CR=1 FL=1
MTAKGAPAGDLWQDDALELDDTTDLLDRSELSRSGMKLSLVFAQALEQIR